MQSCSSSADLQEICEENLDVLIDSGYTLPVQSIKMNNKHNLIKTIILHTTVLKNKAVIDQLKSGLSSLGVLDAIIKHPHLLESYFVAGKKVPLTAGMYSVYLLHCNS